jgi:hypothetical protein
MAEGVEGDLAAAFFSLGTARKRAIHAGGVDLSVGAHMVCDFD